MLILLEHYFELLLSCRNNMFSTSILLRTAPVTTVFNILTGTTNTTLLSSDAWKQAYLKNKYCSQILNFLANPGTIKNKTFQSVHFKYLQPLRQSNIVKEGDSLFLKEYINKDIFVKLRIVSYDLRSIIFLAFHSKTISGHYSPYYIFHSI